MEWGRRLPAKQCSVYSLLVIIYSITPHHGSCSVKGRGTGKGIKKWKQKKKHTEMARRMNGWMENDILPPRFMAEASKYYRHLLYSQIPSRLAEQKRECSAAVVKNTQGKLTICNKYLQERWPWTIGSHLFPTLDYRLQFTLQIAEAWQDFCSAVTNVKTNIIPL